jgi:glycosyltransferase involved in cell wall biosynthesis
MSPGYDYRHFKDYEQSLKYKYKDNIVILGPVNKQEYAQVIKTACCVMSSMFQETFGCVFSESYYLGTPVIADKNSGAVIEIIGEENIVNYNNYDEVYNKFMEIKNNRDNLIIDLDEKFSLDYNLKLWKQHKILLPRSTPRW